MSTDEVRGSGKSQESEVETRTVSMSRKNLL